MIEITPSLAIEESEISESFVRASGPGGQHVNKTSSAAELVFDLAASPSIPEPYKQRALDRLAGRLNGGVLSVRAEDRRSQWMNRQSAMERMAAVLYEATAPEPRARRATKPSRGMNERRLENKQRRGNTKKLRGRPDL